MCVRVYVCQPMCVGTQMSSNQSVRHQYLPWAHAADSGTSSPVLVSAVCNMI